MKSCKNMSRLSDLYKAMETLRKEGVNFVFP